MSQRFAGPRTPPEYDSLFHANAHLEAQPEKVQALWDCVFDLPEPLKREYVRVAGHLGLRKKKTISPAQTSQPQNEGTPLLAEIRRVFRAEVENLQVLHAPPPLSGNQPPQYVTLAEAATLAKVCKKTLERWRKDGKIPEPDVLAPIGKANKWRWDALRPALVEQIGHDLPEQFPSFFPQN